MQKWFCWFALGVGGVLLLLFLLDLVLGFPFGGGFGGSETTSSYPGDITVVDFVGIVMAGIILYLGWSALRDLRG
jgi:hypothetical protein